MFIGGKMRALYFWAGTLLLANISVVLYGQIPAQPRRTPLRELIQELERQNPSVLAGQNAYQASRFESKQASALPDTNVMVQHLSLGSPRPFAGYSNSEFAYIGFGASQDLPFPGKRGLRAKVAESESEVGLRQVAIVREDVIERVKLAYFRLAYLQQTLSLLE